MKILALSGSLKKSSTNSAIIRSIAALAPENIELCIYERLGALPHFNPEIDIDPAPAEVAHLRSELKAADALIICTPEYAFNMPGALKNALDWTVSSGELVEKPVAAISASPSYSGGDKALKSLLMTLTALSCRTNSETAFPIPMALKKLNEKGELLDSETKNKLTRMLGALEILANNT